LEGKKQRSGAGLSEALYQHLHGGTDETHEEPGLGLEQLVLLPCIYYIKWDVGAWTGLIWLRVETGGGLL
jgi:hypothetical protein